MAPAHHVTQLRLVGCPDPNPTYRRFFDPPRGTLSADLDLIGRTYVGALVDTLESWLLAQDPHAPIGVLFSGGIDSGAVLLALHDLLLRNAQSAARLKAFTLAVDGGGSDLDQAREFLRQVDLEYLGEVVEVDSSTLDPLAAVALIEDYNLGSRDRRNSGSHRILRRHAAWGSSLYKLVVVGAVRNCGKPVRGFSKGLWESRSDFHMPGSFHSRAASGMRRGGDEPASSTRHAVGTR